MARIWVSSSQVKRGGLEGDLGIPLRARTSGVTVAVKSSVWRDVGGGRIER